MKPKVTQAKTRASAVERSGSLGHWTLGLGPGLGLWSWALGLGLGPGPWASGFWAWLWAWGLGPGLGPQARALALWHARTEKVRFSKNLLVYTLFWVYTQDVLVYKRTFNIH